MGTPNVIAMAGSAFELTVILSLHSVVFALLGWVVR